MRFAILAVPALLAMTGCDVPYDVAWSSPGGSEAAFTRAQYDCEQSSFARFPPITFGHPGYFATEQSYCSPTPAGPNCVLINPGYLPQARSAEDTNAPPRERDFESCMIARGWRPDAATAAGYIEARTGISRPSRATIRAARAWCESNLKRGVPRDALDECIVDRVDRSG